MTHLPESWLDSLLWYCLASDPVLSRIWKHHLRSWFMELRWKLPGDFFVNTPAFALRLRRSCRVYGLACSFIFAQFNCESTSSSPDSHIKIAEEDVITRSGRRSR
ncbi:hypothetical protein TNCV_1680511 [Trichonephila clavipes]|nr:hypothetical protein TNCV_1680511 [Trichonephila clavipes]